MSPITISLEDMLGRTTVAKPREHDTVFGRGGFVNRNPGNQKFLSLLTKYEREYIQCKQRRYQKTLAVSILHILLQQVRKIYTVVSPLTQTDKESIDLRLSYLLQITTAHKMLNYYL